jgi:beta-glucosidase
MYNPFQAGYSSNVDDRTLHELYLWPFADAIRAGAGSVMTAYNAVNGSATTQNSYLMNNLLKDELGFQGFVMSDWFSAVSGSASALAGLDMMMPGDPTVPLFGDAWWAFHLTEAVLNGTVPVDRLNDMATRIVATWYKMGQDQDYPVPNFSSWTNDAVGQLHPGALISPTGLVNEFVDVQEDHASVAREVAMEAVTLLKNNATLPLSARHSIAVFGSAAAQNPGGPNSCADKGCNEGTLGQGWGSGTADYPYLDDPISALRRRVSNLTEYISDTFPSSISAAEDVALVFITSDSGENYITVEGNPGDRTVAGLHAWNNGDELVQKAAEAYDNVIVIVQTVGPILMEDWHDLPSVKAIVFQHLPGQEAGESLTAVLFGDTAPSGHLPYSITKQESDLPASVDLVYFEFGQPQDTYTERHYIDYRYLNAHNITPRYPFGHGLSYTNFTYSNLTLSPLTPLTILPPSPPPKLPTPQYNTSIPSPTEAAYPEGFSRIWRYLYSYTAPSDAERAFALGQAITSNATTNPYPYPEGYSNIQRPTTVPAGGASGGNPALWDEVFRLSLTITNTGPFVNSRFNASAKHVVQLYVSYPDSIQAEFDTPPLQLRDFVKTRELRVGEAEDVSLVLRRRDLSVWDTRRQNWVVPDTSGFVFWIGDSSGALRFRCAVAGACVEVLGQPVA